MTSPARTPLPVEPFTWEPNDPLAREFALISELVKQSTKDNRAFYNDINLDVTEAGTTMLKADADASARLVLALTRHAAHYDALGKKARASLTGEMERLNWHHTCPEWAEIWPLRQISAQAIRRIMRRKLPFGPEHFISLADWISDSDWLNDYMLPLKALAKAVEHYGPVPVGEIALGDALARAAQAMRDTQQKDLAKLAQQIEVLLPSSAPAEAPTPSPTKFTGPDPSIPAPAGSPRVLIALKDYLGLLPAADPSTATGLPPVSTETGHDHFPLRPDSPLVKEHELISQFLPEVDGTREYYSPDLNDFKTGRLMLESDPATRGRLTLALAERCANASLALRAGLVGHGALRSHYAIRSAFFSLLASGLKLDRHGLFDLILFLSAWDNYNLGSCFRATSGILAEAERFKNESPLTPGERHALYRARCRMVTTSPFGLLTNDLKRLNQLLGDDLFIALVPGEAWSDAVNTDLTAMLPAQRESWVLLLQHAATATAARPSAKWVKSAALLRKAIPGEAFAKGLQRWFPLVNAPRTLRLLASSWDSSGSEGIIHADNANCLRGLAWLAPSVASPDLIRALGALTVSCYRKLPGIGPRAVKVGNAGVYALSQIEDPAALGQLALLKVKVKFGSAQKEIEKAFTAAAERSGLPRDEIEEMSIPSYGLTDVGVCEEQLGDFTARLTVTGTTSTEIEWIKPDGKTQRAVPASVKEKHKDDLKELQAAAKDIQAMLPAQRERIDGLFLAQKTWPLALWRERYLDHPLIGTLARRILWDFKTGDRSATGIWFNGQLVDVDLQPLKLDESKTTVALWHPIGKSTEEILAWRGWLDAQQIQQPFKQAHREIYVLTDAERNTNTYSNRYAAHILKQHQFNALCALRGWKNQLRLMVDAEYLPPTLYLPKWELRAEFWVEGIGQDYGSDTNESGVFLRLSTDQVRFYSLDAAQRAAHAYGGGYAPNRGYPGAEPLPLAEIPPLVFSEVMRDADMFVGVASVGNDPTWNDGGPEGRYREYWQSYSFGDLNASAKTRKEVLQRLLPRLKIAAKCSFEDKFLVVRGQIRTYKIHLGSGNILMQPNDQYLCIVPKQGDPQDAVLLPFEGDRTLSVILSKAFLLADDTKIKDTSITSQIRGK